jgi:hypothetical protein
MKNGICPKCSGREIYRISGRLYAPIAGPLTNGIYPKESAPDKYICVECGYLEYYLDDLKDLQLVRQKWERVSLQ